MLSSLATFASKNISTLIYLAVFLILFIIVIFIYYHDKKHLKKVDYSKFPMSETEIALHRDELQVTPVSEHQKIYCKNCGKSIEPESYFCEFCGQKT